MSSPLTVGSADGVSFLGLTTLEGQLFYLAQLLSSKQSLFNDSHPTTRKASINVALYFATGTALVRAEMPMIGDAVLAFPTVKVAELFPPDTAPVIVPTGTPLTYQALGDSNGVFYWLGTLYGTRAWANPQPDLVTALISSNDSGLPITVLTDRVAGVQFYSVSAPNQWVAFDLGVGRNLKPNAYTLRHDSETSYYLRNWVLQGSNDVAANTLAGINGATWVDLKIHVNDATINSPNGWGVWNIDGVSTAYRWLRVLMTGVESANSRYLVLGEVEFYGLFNHS